MGGVDASGSYGNFAAFAFVFNLVVGVGCLALPKAFQESGLVLGTIVLCFMGFIAYVTLTFVIEAQGAANAMIIVQVVACFRLAWSWDSCVSLLRVLCSLNPE
jgi:amino acid permease